jgi:hypothetical protein
MAACQLGVLRGSQTETQSWKGGRERRGLPQRVHACVIEWCLMSHLSPAAQCVAVRRDDPGGVGVGLGVRKAGGHG